MHPAFAWLLRHNPAGLYAVSLHSFIHPKASANCLDRNYRDTKSVQVVGRKSHSFLLTEFHERSRIQDRHSWSDLEKAISQPESVQVGTSEGCIKRRPLRSCGREHERKRSLYCAMVFGDGSTPSPPNSEQQVSMDSTLGLDQRKVKFCSQCGQPTVHQVPPDDERGRDVCPSPSCGTIHYCNPKLVVGALCLWENQVLLCKRGIEPCRGKWGFPQGYMELGESTREGAAREVWEEAGAVADIGPLLAVYNVPGQVQLLYLAQLKSPQIAPGIESLEADLFPWEMVPTLELAFPTVGWALEYARQVLGKEQFLPQQRTKIAGQGGPSTGSHIDESMLFDFVLQSKF